MSRRTGAVVILAILVIAIWALTWVLGQFDVNPPAPIATLIHVLLIVSCVGLALAFVVFVISLFIEIPFLNAPLIGNKPPT